jgi:mannose-1-phosphate guanylyltransferase
VSSILFAAGLGKRLRPLTDVVAKPALPVLDVPLGSWGLASLLRSAPPVIVNASHLPGTIKSAFAWFGLVERSGWEMFLEEPEGFGTAGTLRALRDRFEGPVVTHNGDLICDLDPALVLRSHAKLGALATVVVKPVDDRADMELDGDVVRTVIDRRETSIPGWQFVGLAAFEPAALQLLPDERPAGLGETLLPLLAERGQLAAHRFHGYALDVGTPERYLRANLDALYGIAPSASHPGVVLDVPGGLAYAGPEAVVHGDSLGPGAIVLSGARVEEGARLENAVVWPNERVPASAHISDAIWAFDGPIEATI